MKKEELLSLLNSDYGGGQTPLILACKSLKIGLVKKLLNAGVDVNKYDSDGRSAINHSIWVSRKNEFKRPIIKILKELIKHGADIDPVHEMIVTPLMDASFLSFTYLVDDLLRKKTNVNHEDFDGDTALFCAIYGGNISIMRKLIANGANTNHINGFGTTPLMNIIGNPFDDSVLQKSAITRKLKMTEILLEENVKLDAKDLIGNTALIYAAIAGQFQVVKKLIQKGADMTIKNLDNKDFYDILLGQDKQKTKYLMKWLSENKPVFVENKKRDMDAAKFGI